MSMVINLVEDHNIYLCEGGPVYNGGVQPTPITYLTQWKIVGNSEVHTLPYPDGVVLPTGYKRCEYLESDGTAYIEVPITFTPSDSIVIKAAIKTVTDWKGFIAPKTWLPTENKRFVMGSCVSKDNKHLWSPALGGYGQGNKFFTPELEADTDVHTWSYNNGTFIIDDIYTAKLNSGNFTTDNLRIFYGYNTPFASKICDYHHIKADAEYHLIPCLDSNDTPCMYDVINNQAYYNSAGSGSFTYKLYPQPAEIWSCGEYNPTDGKYHILVQPLGGSVANVALTEPLRKVNNVADSIEFPAALEAFTDADGNQIATTLPDDTILHIQNLYEYTQISRVGIDTNNISQRSAEIKITQTTSASYCGIGMPLQSGKYYSSCLLKNEDAKPNIIYSNSGNSSTVSSSDYQKISLLQSNVNTFRYSALNSPVGVWEVNDVFFVKDINIFDIDAMFADCADLKPASASDFEALFPNLGCIDRINTAIDIIVKDGKLYKYVETEGKALVTRTYTQAKVRDLEFVRIGQLSNCIRFRSKTLETKHYSTNAAPNILFDQYICMKIQDANSAGQPYAVTSYMEQLYLYCPLDINTNDKFDEQYGDYDIVYELATPTTELVDAPQIEEADSYTCVISLGAKAVSWSSFDTD